MSRSLPSKLPLNCLRCGLYQGCLSYRIQADVSNPKQGTVDVLFVGEAPGEEEDRQGMPFVGPAGAFLRTFLAGMDSWSWALTNVVKCRPVREGGGNRQPTRSEIQACLPFLAQEIEQLSPRVIVLLGGTALKAVWPSGPRTIQQARTMPFQENGRWVLTTYHPATWVYASNDQEETRMQEVVEEYERLFQLIDDILAGRFQEQDAPDIRLATSPADLVEMLRRVQEASVVAIDIETSSTPRDPARKEIWQDAVQVIGMGVAVDEKAAWYVPANLLSRQLVHDILTGRKVVGHNLKYDLTGMAYHGLLDPHLLAGLDVEDTLLLHASQDAGRGDNGLKAVATRLLRVPDWSRKVWGAVNELDRARTLENTSRKKNGLPLLPAPSLADCPVEDVAEYCGRDALYTLRLWHVLKNDPPPVYPLLKKAMLTLALIELQGVGCSARRLGKLRQLIEDRVSALESRLFSSEASQRVCLKDASITPSVYSWKYLERLLQETGLVVEEKTPSGRSKLSKDILAELAELSPEWKLVAGIKNLRGLLSKFLVPISEVLTSDGRLHTSYNMVKVERSAWVGAESQAGQSGTVTGRLSARYLLTIKKDDALRLIFVPRPGHVMWELDYERGEPVWITILSRCQFWKDIFLADLDLYRVMAARFILDQEVNLDRAIKDQEYARYLESVLAEKVPENLRNVMKTGILATMYLQQLPAFCKRAGVSLETGQRFFQAFEAECPELFAWRNRQIQKVTLLDEATIRRLTSDRPGESVEAIGVGEPLITPYGRKRTFEPVNGRWSIHALAQIVNYEVQSSLSDTTLSKACEIVPFCRQHPHRPVVCNIVHDALWGEARAGTVLEDLRQIASVMQDMSTLPIDTWGVPLRVSAKVGPDLGAMQKASV